MIYYNILVFFIAFLGNHLINYVSGLNMEGIVNGFHAIEGQFKYQVLIMAKLNDTFEDRIMCGGGIITYNLILTAAQCFIDGSHSLRRLSFSVVTAAQFFSIQRKNLIDIDLIYVHRQHEHIVQNDIALAKLKEKLDLNDPLLSYLDLPIYGESFPGFIGLLAGHGYNWVETKFNFSTGAKRRVHGDTDSKLRFALVEIVEDKLCKDMYYNINTSKHLCGRMLIESPGLTRGFCSRDTGSPLVIRNKVVGIVSRNTPDCDDTEVGGIYTKTTAFLHFITLVKGNAKSDDIVIHQNPIHVINI